MAQTVLEINTLTSDNKNNDGSYFSQVFGEPILVKAGSTIDFLNGFIDLGTDTTGGFIFLPEKLRLGLDFYRYEYDNPQLPASQGTDGGFYGKRYKYFAPSAVDVPDIADQASIIDEKVINDVVTIPQPTQYGNKMSAYGNTNAPAFIAYMDLRQNNTLSDGSTEREEFFVVQEEEIYIDIDAGYYSKVKFAQIVNDKFNLITGSLVNYDKPLETYSRIQNPTIVTGQNRVTPLDYQMIPNVNSSLLKVYEYGYNEASIIESDPDALTDKTKFYGNDFNWNYWFFPVQTIPSDPTKYLEEIDQPPYIWYDKNQTGFMAGTSKFNLNYDTDNDVFFIDYLHTPILDTEQREVVLFSKARIWYSNPSGNSPEPFNVGYKARGSLGGLLVSRLFSYKFDSQGNPIQADTGFWRDTLGFTGFDDAFRHEIATNFLNKQATYYNNYQLDGSQRPQNYGITYTFHVRYPDPKYLDIATTTPLIPVQWLQQSNFSRVQDDKGMSIYSSDIPKIFQSIGNRVISGDSRAYVKPDPYWYIDVNISHVANDNFRDRDSYRQIMSVAGKTYNSGLTYIQLFADNSVQALSPLTEDIYIDKIEVKILNADKSLAQNLGNQSSIFLKITQPIIMENPQSSVNPK